jgi:hypothetical protein
MSSQQLNTYRRFLRSPTPLDPNEIRYCATCRRSRPAIEFYRLRKIYKECNKCAEVAKVRRQKKAAEAGHALARQGTLVWPTNGLSNIQQRAGDQILQLHQEYYQRQHQDQNMLQAYDAQHGSSMALNNLGFDRVVYQPPPTAVSKQSQRITHETQNLYSPRTIPSEAALQGPVSYPNPHPPLHFEPFQTHPLDMGQDANVGIGQGIRPDSGLMDPNFYCKLYAPADAMQHETACDYTYYDLEADLDGEADPDDAGYTEEIDIYQSPWNAQAADGFPPLPEAVLFDEREGLASTRPFYQSDSMVTTRPNKMSINPCSLSDGLSPSQLAELSAYNAAHQYPIDTPMDVDMVDADPQLTLEDSFDLIDAVPVEAITQSQTGTPVQPARKSRNMPVTVNLDAYFADYPRHKISFGSLCLSSPT